MVAPDTPDAHGDLRDVERAHAVHHGGRRVDGIAHQQQAAGPLVHLRAMASFSWLLRTISITRCSSPLIFSRSISAWRSCELGALAVRAGELHAGQNLGVALEEAGRAQQKVGDVFFGDGWMMGSWCVGDVDLAFKHGGGRAGHENGIGLLAAQAMVSSPPRICTCTRVSSSPR